MSEWCKEVAHGDRETSPTPYPAYFEAAPLSNATIAATASAEPYGAHTRPMWMIDDRGTASGESARPAERATGARVAADSSRPSAGCRSSTRAVRKRMPAEVFGSSGTGNSVEERLSRGLKVRTLIPRKVQHKSALTGHALSQLVGSKFTSFPHIGSYAAAGMHGGQTPNVSFHEAGQPCQKADGKATSL